MFSQLCHVWSRSIAEVDRAARSQYHRLVRAWSPPQNMDRNRSKLLEHLECKWNDAELIWIDIRSTARESKNPKPKLHLQAPSSPRQSSWRDIAQGFAVRCFSCNQARRDSEWFQECVVPYNWTQSSEDEGTLFGLFVSHWRCRSLAALV